MNLYRLLYVNKHDARLSARERLLGRISNQQDFSLKDMNEIRAYRGLEPIDESRILDVRTLTKKAFSASDLTLKFRSLKRIKGVGNSLASEILAFQNPYKYAAVTHKVWNILVSDFDFDAEEKESEDDVSLQDYVKYLEKIRDVAVEYGMKPADAEFVLNYLYK
ncbi:MAG: hypothetical protein ABH834_04240 [Candidatus Altiarchaeota archaeon]